MMCRQLMARVGITWLLGALLTISCTVASAAPNPPSSALPANSIYQLNVPLMDQNGQSFSLDSRRGKPLLISMFYSGCQYVCPRIVEALKRTERQLPLPHRNNVPILMVTFDVKHDDPKALKAVATERQLDDALWTLARSDEGATRKLAALLDIQFRELESGDFNHTSVLILLDAEGRIVGRTAVIGEADPAFVMLVAKQMAMVEK